MNQTTGHYIVATGGSPTPRPHILGYSSGPEHPSSLLNSLDIVNAVMTDSHYYIEAVPAHRIWNDLDTYANPQPWNPVLLHLARTVPVPPGRRGVFEKIAEIWPLEWFSYVTGNDEWDHALSKRLSLKDLTPPPTPGPARELCTACGTAYKAPGAVLPHGTCKMCDPDAPTPFPHAPVNVASQDLWNAAYARDMETPATICRTCRTAWSTPSYVSHRHACCAACDMDHQPHLFNPINRAYAELFLLRAQLEAMGFA